MKKAITVLLAVGLIFGLAGTAMAVECATCVPPETINRGCEGVQSSCLPFDYEDQHDFGIDNYCEAAPNKAYRRVVFPICDCTDQVGLIEQGDIVDVRLEILVNGEKGDNGAYWAQDVNADGGIGVSTYVSQNQACAEPTFDSFFRPDFVFQRYDQQGNVVPGTVSDMHSTCTIPDDSRVTIIEPDINSALGAHGYQVSAQDDADNAAQWAIDIPYIWFDPAIVSSDDEISVEICLATATDHDNDGVFDGYVDTGGVCGGGGCCCVFPIGDLCCPEPTASYDLIYPYTTPMNDANWWYGMVITNLSSTAGTATVTVYENDGDSGSVEVEVPANGMFVRSNMELMDMFGEGIGDARAYFHVNTDFSASGFLFIGNDGKAEAMGYLPVER